MNLSVAPGEATPRRVEASGKRVLALAAPMMLSHVTTPLLGLVDAAVIGRLGDATLLGAVALGAIVFDFLFWTFGALRMGTAGLTAQAYGAGRDEEVGIALARALIMAGAIGLAIIVLQKPLSLIAFDLLGASDGATDAARTYVAVRIWAAPFTLTNYCILGSVIGRGRTDLGLVLQVAINVVNMGLAILFVTGLGWGVAGSAAATLVAECAGAGLGLFVLARLGTRPWRVPRNRVLDWAGFRRAISVNADIMVRTIALLFAFAFFTSRGARAGDTVLAANAVLMNMFLVGGYFLDGFATAAEQLGGQAVGAGEPSAFRRIVRLALVWSVCVGCALSGLFWLGSDLFIALVSTSEPVRLEARGYAIYAALTPLAGAAAFAFDGIYIGATWTRAMRNLMLVALGIYLLSWLCLRPFGNAGLWASLLIFLVARGLAQACAYPMLAARLMPQGADYQGGQARSGP